MSWFEKHFGKYCVSNLSLIMIIFYGFGYVLQGVNAQFLQYLTLNPYAILHGQVWRLVTWLLVPPETSNLFFVLIAMLFYYSIGTSLERTWGTVRYNEYLLQGILFTIAGAFIVHGLTYVIYGGLGVGDYQIIATYFTTYYVLMSIFLAYAATFPEAVVLLFFILPIKVKWLGIAYGALLAYEFLMNAIHGGWFICVAMAASLLNFFLFFWRSRDLKRFRPSDIKRRNDFKRAVNGGKTVNGSWRPAGGNGASGASGRNGASRAAGRNGAFGAAGGRGVKMQAAHTVHKCAICGRTDETNPELEFRYCSKCAGGYEFCSEHLFNHVHAANGSAPTLREPNA